MWLINQTDNSNGNSTKDNTANNSVIDESYILNKNTETPLEVCNQFGGFFCKKDMYLYHNG